jgi:hypothetical protein
MLIKEIPYSEDDGYSSEFTASPVDPQDEQGEIVILYDSEADYWTTEATK